MPTTRRRGSPCLLGTLTLLLLSAGCTTSTRATPAGHKGSTYASLPGPSSDSLGAVQCNHVSAVPSRPGAGTQPMPDLSPVEMRWPSGVTALTSDAVATEAHYRAIWKDILNSTEVDAFSLGTLPYEVLFLTRPGGYSTAQVQVMRQIINNSCLLGTPITDEYRGTNGAFGRPGSFALAAHGVAVLVIGGTLDPRESLRVISSLQA